MTQRHSLRSHRPGQGENHVLFFVGHSGAFHSAPAPAARGREVAKLRADCGRAPPPPALRSTRLRNRPQKKVLVVRARTRGFPPSSLADTPAIHRGATTPPARGRAPLPNLAAKDNPNPNTSGRRPEPRWGFSTPRPPSNLSPTRTPPAAHPAPMSRSTSREEREDKFETARKTPTPLPPAARAEAHRRNVVTPPNPSHFPLWKNHQKLSTLGVQIEWTPTLKNDRVPTEWTPPRR